MIPAMEVKTLRQITGLTQREFSTRYQIPLKTLQNWESDADCPSARKCPQYVIFLLEKAVMADFKVARNLLGANIDERHLMAIEEAKIKIRKSPLARYVRDVMLYGSTARGTARHSSDIDILMILDDDVKDNKSAHEWITYLKGNISSEDFTLPETDLHVAYESKWKEKNDAFFSNIKKEGFSIWN